MNLNTIINIYNLQNQICAHTYDYDLVSNNVALKEAYKVFLKSELEKCYANLECQIRKNPTFFDIDKVTESAIESRILSDIQYQSINKDYIEADKDVRIAIAQKETIQTKTKCFEMLVALETANK